MSRVNPSNFLKTLFRHRPIEVAIGVSFLVQIHSFSSDCLRISDSPLSPPDYNVEPGSSSLRYFAQSSNPDIRSPRKMPNASALIVNIVIGGWKGGIKNTTTI